MRRKLLRGFILHSAVAFFAAIFKTGLPSEFYSRDYVHSGELGKQIIGRIALGYFVMSAETP